MIVLSRDFHPATPLLKSPMSLLPNFLRVAWEVLCHAIKRTLSSFLGYKEQSYVTCWGIDKTGGNQ